jgi:hypothetical protein
MKAHSLSESSATRRRALICALGCAVLVAQLAVAAHGSWSHHAAEGHAQFALTASWAFCDFEATRPFEVSLLAPGTVVQSVVASATRNVGEHPSCGVRNAGCAAPRAPPASRQLSNS